VQVPGYLLCEFREACEACVVCGQLSGETIVEMRLGGVAVGAVMSGELEGWLAGVVAQDDSSVARDASTAVEGVSLKRKGAVRRGRSGVKMGMGM
jgi:hypothetical protein